MSETFRALNATCIAWLAAGHVSPSAREILIQRMDVLARSAESVTGGKVKRTVIRDLDRAGALTQAAILLVRDWQTGGDLEAAERALARLLFDYFLDRSEEAMRHVGLSPAMLAQLGIGPGDGAA